MFRQVPRLTVRRLMIAVAFVGIVLGLTIARRNRFRQIEAHHAAKLDELVGWMPTVHYNPVSLVMLRADWHESMRLKYQQAARYPWLPVGLDPPEPR